MSTDLELFDHLELVNKVAQEYLTGKNVREIATTLSLSRNKTNDLLNEWRGMVSNNAAIRSRAREALAGADQHYSTLIGRAYEVIDEADSRTNLSAKTAAIKLIADMEAKRIDMLQKSGLLENKELAEEMVETQERQKKLEAILKDVVAKCDVCRPHVMDRLSKISDEAVTVEVV